MRSSAAFLAEDESRASAREATRAAAARSRSAETVVVMRQVYQCRATPGARRADGGPPLMPDRTLRPSR